MLDFLIDTIANNLEVLTSTPVFVGRLMKPRSSGGGGSSSDDDDDDVNETVSRTGLIRRSSGGSSDPDPEPDPEPTSSGGETGLGFDAGVLTPEQIEAIRNQDFVDEPAGDTGLGFEGGQQLSNDELRAIANQDFVDEEITQSINQQLDALEGVSLADQEDEVADSDTDVDTSTTVTPEEMGSDTTTSDMQERINEFMDRIQSLQEQLLAATQPTAEEESLREQIRERRADFQEAQATSRARHAPQFAIRGETAARRQQFSREQDRLSQQLQAEVTNRSNRVDQLNQQMANTSQNFQLMQNLQQMTRPDVLSTQVNQQTGEVSAIVQDPMTGAVSIQSAGSVTPEESELDWRGPVTLSDGTQALYAQTEDGIQVKRIPGSIASVDQIEGQGGDDDPFDSNTFETPTGETITIRELATGEGLKRAINDMGVNPADAQAQLEERFQSGTVDAIFKAAGISLPTGGQDTGTTNPIDTQTIRNDILGYMSDDELSDHAESSGFTTGGFLGIGSSGDTQAYLENVRNYINGLMRSQGMTREEAIKEWRS